MGVGAGRQWGRQAAVGQAGRGLAATVKGVGPNVKVASLKAAGIVGIVPVPLDARLPLCVLIKLQCNLGLSPAVFITWGDLTKRGTGWLDVHVPNLNEHTTQSASIGLKPFCRVCIFPVVSHLMCRCPVRKPLERSGSAI